VQDVRPATHALRSASDGQTIIPAVLVLAGLRRHLRIKIHVVCDKQVKVTVAVVVHKRATGVPSRRRTVVNEGGLLRDISKRPISIIVVKDDPTPIRHDEIVMSIVVIVSDAAPLPPPRSNQPGFLRYVSKGSVAVIVKQEVGRLML